ncbi:hypothetical protein CHS0354_001045 [Potamilus streckersoni]|uniref:Uncharacterized protein n=1 Tax=Potamilus streckersoni TaxID=2493646 RepID=A0AAE0SUK0_9BIVA|nr:hypothetical protein CHS0354_001045 [Potamilus streckersoni]
MSQSLSPYPMLKDGYCARGKLERVRTRDAKTTCFGRLWIFLLLGTLIGVFGLVIGGLYFNLQAVTNSTEHTEIFPSYIVSILVLVTSVSVIALFWRRIKILVLVSVLLCLLTIVLGGIKAVLTGTHILQPFLSLTRCQYDLQHTLCRCYSPYKRSALLNLQYSYTELYEYNFGGVSSCNPVESVIPQLLYTLIATCTIVVLLCIATAVLALLVLRIERNRLDFLKDEVYEEVYTVSGSSSSIQDQSDNELDTLVLQSAVSTNSCQESRLVPSNSNGATLDRSRSLRSVKSTVSKRDKSLCDLEPKATSSQSRQKLKDSGDANGTHSLIRTKQLSKSCESFDSLNKSADCTSSESLSKSTNCTSTFRNSDVTSVPQTKSKLKEHRRKGRRAVTLHNLDTETLMVILGLQLRYLQETKELKSKSERTESQQSRRVCTPQPTLQKTHLPPNIRSHTPQPASHTTPISLNVRSNTPQPYKTTQPSLLHNEKDFCTTVRPASQGLSQNQELFYNTEATPDIQQERNQNCLSETTQGYKTAPTVRQGIYNPYLYNQPVLSSDNIHYITYSDNMLNHPIQRPRSRPKLEDVFFPPQPPIHQGNHQLPPQPISRPSSRNKQLPPEPLHRGGKSAFHAVETHKLKTNHGRSISPKPVKDLMNTVHKPKVADYAELAIRENFRLYPSNVIQRMENQEKSTSKSHGVCKSEKQSVTTSEVPPPYAPPPSYLDFLSACNTSMISSASSNPEELYSQPNPRHKETAKSVSHPGTVKVTSPGTISHRSDPGCSHTETIYGNNMNCPHQEHNQVKTGRHMYQNYGRNYVAMKEGIHSASNKNIIKENTSENFYSQVQKRKPQIGIVPVYANSEHVTLNQPVSSHRLGSGSNHEYEDVYEYQENGVMDPSVDVNSHKGKAQVQKGPHQGQYDVSIRPKNLDPHFVPHILIRDDMVDKSSHPGQYDMSVTSRKLVVHGVPQILITGEEVDEVFESPTPIEGQGHSHHLLPSQSRVSIVTGSIQGQSVQDDVKKNQTWTERQKFINEGPKEASRLIFLEDPSNSSRLSSPGVIIDGLGEKLEKGHDALTLIQEKNTKVGSVKSIIVTPGEGLAGALMEGRLQQTSVSESLSSSDSEFAETGV